MTDIQIRPISWEWFKALPIQGEREYYKALRNRFSASTQMIADMFGVHKGTFSRYCGKMGLGDGLILRTDCAAAEDWEKFLRGEITLTVPAAEEAEDPDLVANLRKQITEQDEIIEAMGAEADRLTTVTASLRKTISAQESELEVLRGQMQVVWGFLRGETPT